MWNILWVIALGLAESPIGDLQTVAVDLKRNPAGFEMLVGDGCFCSKAGQFKSKGPVLQITDHPQCAVGLKSTSIAWRNELERPITVVAGQPHQTLKSLRHKLNTLKNSGKDIEILSDEVLPCLVFATNLQIETPESEPAGGERKTFRKVPGMPGDINERHNKGLFMNPHGKEFPPGS